MYRLHPRLLTALRRAFQRLLLDPPPNATTAASQCGTITVGSQCLSSIIDTIFVRCSFARFSAQCSLGSAHVRQQCVCQMNNFEDCCAACNNNSKCSAWTFGSPFGRSRCWLASPRDPESSCKPNPRSRRGVVSRDDDESDADGDDGSDAGGAGSAGDPCRPSAPAY